MDAGQPAQLSSWGWVGCCPPNYPEARHQNVEVARA